MAKKAKQVKAKEVSKNGVQKRQEEARKEIKQALVRPEKLALRISEGWKEIEKQGDLILIQKEI